MMQIATLHGGARIKANKQKILEDLLDTTKQLVQAHQTFSHCAMFFDKGRASSASSSSSLKLETFVLLFEILLLLLPCLSSFSASETDEAPVLCVQIKSSLLLSVLQLRLKCKWRFAAERAPSKIDTSVCKQEAKMAAFTWPRRGSGLLLCCFQAALLILL